MSEYRMAHRTCDDSWYSCPESGDCSNPDEHGCTCGADYVNAELDRLRAHIAELEGIHADQLDGWKEEVDEWKEKAELLDAENARLRAALEAAPHPDYVEPRPDWDRGGPDHYRTWFTTTRAEALK